MGVPPAPEPTHERDWAELLLSIGVVIFGAVVIWQTTQIRVTPAYSKVGPQAVPFIVGGGLVLVGLWLAFGFGIVDFSMGWMWLKAAMVLALSGVHGWYGGLLRKFQNDQNTRPHTFYRAINEIPFVIAIVIVIAVIVKPF